MATALPHHLGAPFAFGSEGGVHGDPAARNTFRQPLPMLSTIGVVQRKMQFAVIVHHVTFKARIAFAHAVMASFQSFLPQDVPVISTSFAHRSRIFPRPTAIASSMA